MDFVEDVFVFDEVIELACDATIFASDDVCGEEGAQHVGREVVHVANGSGHDGELATRRSSVDCLREGTGVGEGCQ